MKDGRKMAESSMSLRGLLFIAVCSAVVLGDPDCPDGKYGWKCKFNCSCAHSDVCDKISGDCPNGCSTNKYGPGCSLWSNQMYDRNGENYMGFENETENRKWCLYWEDLRIKENMKSAGYTASSFPDKSFPRNYCRNPIGHTNQSSAKPFCFVLIGDAVNFENCDIQKGECEDGRYGENCVFECHCAKVSEVCDKSIGKCDSGCHAGWKGPSCRDKCETGMFGDRCGRVCGHCQRNLLHGHCDPETGTCLMGCLPGWSGHLCQTRCGAGFYGANCVKECGNCLGNEVCNGETGKCYNGCEAGYMEETCLKVCHYGKYGRKCAQTCGQCFGQRTCDPVGGVCVEGCASGWKGTYCLDDCEAGFHGENCSLVCGHCKAGESCDRTTGQCISGCESGYTGQMCLQAAQVQVMSSTASGILAAVIIAGLVIGVIVGIILCKRKNTFRAVLEVTNKDDTDEEIHLPNSVLVEESKETDTLLNVSTTENGRTRISEVSENNHNEEIEEPIYANVNSKLSSPVQVEELYDYVQKNKENECDGFKSEYAELPSGLLALYNAARKPENRHKNRYNNIVAYDHTRVILEPFNNDSHSDYVNANFIDGYNRPKAYITSQGPNKAMLRDYWRMVWQKKICKVVMLTNLVEACKKKCEQYWPDEGLSKFGGITVEILNASKFTDYTVRTFKIVQDDSSRIVKQFHFTTWSDHGAPASAIPLLNLRRKVLMFNPDSSDPILVHCSAGIGRTGTYCALDYLLQQAKAEGIVDVLGFAQLMRTQRVNMIQTWEQYVFVYDALLEATMAGETTIPCSAYRESYEKLCTLQPSETSTPLEKQYEVLQKLACSPDRDEYKASLLPENLNKNRFKNILPANRCRPFLYTPVEECNDFINAVFLPGYMNRDAFIVTQMPLPETVADFWRMLYDYHSDTVIMLNEFDRNDKSCALYWPEEYGYTVEYGPLSIELLSSSEADQNVTVRIFKLSHLIKSEERAIKQFQFKSWTDYQSVPGSTTALLKLHDMVYDWLKQNGKGPVTVHCMNGASKSGLYCAMSVLFERMRLDYEVDVFQTVRQIRLNRPQFIENMEQFQFCYQMALEFLDNQ